MTISKKIGVGIIGCGKVAEIIHLPGYYENSLTEIVTVCDTDEKRAKEVAKRFGAKNYCTKYEDLLKREDINAVSVCTPNYLHCEQTIAAAEAGKNVLVEKPMATNPQECDRMVKACKKAGVKLMVAVNSRFDPTNQKIKEILDAGVIGKILQIKYHAAYAGPYEFWPAVSQWFFDKTKVGGGCLIDYGAHIVDLLRWLAGDISSVFGIGGTLLKNIEGEDNVLVLLNFKEGTMGEFDISWNFKGFRVSTEIIGSKGGVFVGTPPSSISIHSNKVSTMPGSLFYPEIPLTLEEMFSPQKKKIDCFVESIVTDKEPSVTGEDGRAILEVILAVYKSMKNGKRINL